MNIATCESAGVTSRRSWSRLPSRSGAIELSPVRLPPGRARLGTRPVPIGSPTATMTSGTVVVIADLWWACAIGAEKCYPRGLVSLLCTNNYRPHQCRADEADNFPSPHARSNLGTRHSNGSIQRSEGVGMSALGHKRTFAVQKGMSALPQKRTFAGAVDAATPRTARMPPRKFSLIAGPPLAAGHALAADEKAR